MTAHDDDNPARGPWAGKTAAERSALARVSATKRWARVRAEQAAAAAERAEQAAAELAAMLVGRDPGRGAA
jgi:hypothetical protein